MKAFYQLLIFSLLLNGCTLRERGTEDNNGEIITGVKPLIYLVDYLREDGKLIVSWKYNARYEVFKSVHLKRADGSPVATIDYPVDYYLLEEAYPESEILLQVENNNGEFSKGYRLNLDRDREYTKLLETGPVDRVVIEKEAPRPYFHKKGDPEQLRLFGTNYVRLRGKEGVRTEQHDHSTFEAATVSTEADYNPYHAETLFRIMKARGLNFVRVFIIGRYDFTPGISGPSELNEPLYGPYMDNVIDFLERARRYGIYVYPCFGDGDLPQNEWYRSRLPSEFQSKLFEVSHYFPFIEEAVDLKAKYITAFLNYIREYDETLIHTLLAVELQNEYNLRSDLWPFTLQTGIFEAYWGDSYDMTDAASRQKLADDATIHYQNRMVEAVDKTDPEILVAEGFFSLDIVGKNAENSVGLFPDAFEDKRYPPRFNVSVRSNIDFIDIHEYPVIKGLPMKELFRRDMNSMMDSGTEMEDILSKKPVILGEFGGFVEFETGDMKAIAARMAELAGFAMEKGFSGWCYWTFDTFEQKRLYSMMEQNQEIMDALSP